jgi:hypothetical protein
MKKKLIILVEILVLIVFLRSDMAKYFLDDISGAITSAIDSLSGLPEKRELGKLRDSIESHSIDLSDAQRDYVAEITLTKDTLNRFYYLYCVNKDINPYIFGQNLVVTCGEIDRAGILKN